MVSDKVGFGTDKDNFLQLGLLKTTDGKTGSVMTATGLPPGTPEWIP